MYISIMFAEFFNKKKSCNEKKVVRGSGDRVSTEP